MMWGDAHKREYYYYSEKNHMEENVITIKIENLFCSSVPLFKLYLHFYAMLPFSSQESSQFA